MVDFVSLDQAVELFADPADSIKEDGLDILKRYALMKVEVKELKDAYESKKAELADLEVEGLAILDASGVARIEVEGRLLSPSSRKWYYVKADQKEAAHTWLKDNGFEALVQPAVNVQSLSAQLKEYEEQGQEVPTELFNISNKRQLRATK